LSPGRIVWDNPHTMLSEEDVRGAVGLALREDVGAGDITSNAVVPEGLRATGIIVARENMIVCGLDVARETFRQVDTRVVWETALRDGAPCGPGTEIGRVTGKARSILAAERTALNFLQRLCGIATTTARMVALVRGTGVQIADTRKTVPGLRALDKYAVAAGGGTNHRAGLYDAYLIKDNHWRLAGGVGEAVRRARAALGGRPAPGVGIEIEVTTPGEAREAVAAGADALLLDNMDDALLAETVAALGGRAFLEVSGGVREERLARLAALGIQRISIGSLTHSVRAVDIALELEAA
jgi:nicotinate-nucleotide pyrophosphorylase (carboxylating)